MGLDFHDRENKHSYSKRQVDKNWLEFMGELVKNRTLDHVVDLGCGGGLYTKAMGDMGARHITGVDFSEVMLEGAREYCTDCERIDFQLGTAHETGLPSVQYDLLLARAVIHHLEDLEAFLTEAYRLLKPGGVLIIQDRTVDDCFLEADENHIRGYLFELFPQLKKVEAARRYGEEAVVRRLESGGFERIEVKKLWEMRQQYFSKQKLFQDIKERKGKSILHKISDTELEQLVNYMDGELTDDGEISEKDRWTVWKGIKR